MASFFASLRNLFQPKPDQDGAAAASAGGPALQPAGSAAAASAATLGVPQLVATAGMFPVRGDDGAAMFTLGMVQSFAGTVAAYGAPRADGQLLRIAQNPPLYSVIGNAFGGDSIQTFALPNLKGVVAAGGGFVGEAGQGTLSVTFLIAATSMAAAPALGTIIAFAGNYAPAGWLVADGSKLAIADNVPLFETIGTAFGGDGAATFMLPSLSPPPPTAALTVPLGVGSGPGRMPVTLGQQVPGAVGSASGLGLNFLISVDGMYPPTGGSGDFPEDDTFLGQVIAFAGKAPPQGWALCDGSLLAIQSNPALYSLLGTLYGGDGTRTFALPDLRGRAMAGV